MAAQLTLQKVQSQREDMKVTKYYSIKYSHFFKTGVAPISKEETIEIFTFMKASNMSKEQNGRIVSMEEAYREGLKDAQKLIKTYK